jgi:hypothetical protein
MNCLDCDTPVSKRSKGRCRRCSAIFYNRDPEVRGRRSATWRKRFADPAIRAAHGERTRAGMARAMTDPAFVEERRRLGRVYGAPNIETTRSEESRAKAGKRISAVKLAHIPGDMREDYRRLVRKGFTSAQAVALIEEHVEAERRRVRVRMGVA